MSIDPRYAERAAPGPTYWEKQALDLAASGGPAAPSPNGSAHPDNRDSATALREVPTSVPGGFYDKLLAAGRSTTIGGPEGCQEVAEGLIGRYLENFAAIAASRPGRGLGWLAVRVNLAQRPQEAMVHPPHARNYTEVYADIFGQAGLIESLPPEHAATAIAAATGGEDPTAVTAHTDIVRNVIKTLETTMRDESTGALIVVRPNFQQIVEAIGIWDRARLGEQPGSETGELYPEHPTSLTETQIQRVLSAANTDRLGPIALQLSLLRMRLDNILSVSDEVSIPQASSLFPSSGGDHPFPIQLSRISVNPNSYGPVLDAEVRAAGVGVLALVTGALHGRPAYVIIEAADELAKRDPETLQQILTKARSQKPPVPVHLTFEKVSPNIRDFMTRIIALVGRLDPTVADEISEALPDLPMADLVSQTRSTGASAGRDIGIGSNVGYHPDKTRPESGTMANSSSSAAVTADTGETIAYTMRPPNGAELMAGAPNKSKVIAIEAGVQGPVVGVYDLYQGGRQVRDSLPSVGAQPAIGDSVVEDVETGRRRPTAVPTPLAMPPHPKPPKGGGPRTGETSEIHVGGQLQDLAMRAGQGGKIDVELLKTWGINEWIRQVGPEVASSPESWRLWVEWCVRRGVSSRMAGAAWNERVAMQRGSSR